jgi:SRSO17 transposase
VDDYCQWYQSLFPEVRSFEAFKHLHIGMISDIKRKSLPAIAFGTSEADRKSGRAGAGAIITSLSQWLSLESRTVEAAKIKTDESKF